MAWNVVHAGRVWSQPPYRIILRGDDELGEVYEVFRRSRRAPLGHCATLSGAQQAAEEYEAERERYAAESIKRSGRPTRYRKTHDCPPHIHQEGFEKITRLARKYKTSKADMLCGLIDAAPEEIELPEPKIPTQWDRESPGRTPEPPTA